MDTKWVQVGTFSTAIDAARARNYLSERGVSTMVADANTGSVFAGVPNIGQVHLHVAEEDEEEALEALAAFDKSLRAAHAESEKGAGEPEPEGPVPGADEADAEQEVGPPPAPAPAQRTDAEIAGEKWARTTRTWAWLSLFVWPVLFGIFWRLFSAPAALTHEARRALGHAWALAMTALVLAIVGVACLLLL